MNPIIATLSLSVLLPSLATSIANVALPTLARVFSVTFLEVQWVVLAYLLAITTLVVSLGRLGDIVGRRRLLLAGIALFTVASFLAGLAPTLTLLVAVRAAQGLGAAIMMALTMAFVPQEKTGSAVGLLATMSALGTSIGPSLGGVLIASFGWPAIFHLNVPLGILNLVLAYRTLPADRIKTHPAFDIAGTFWLALALAAYALAMTSLNLPLVLAALFGIGLFVLAESKAPSPLIPLGLFKTSQLCAPLALTTLASTVVMATLVVGPFQLSGALALDPAQVGLVMSSGPMVAALTGLPAGRLVDRFGAPPLIILGLGAMMVGCSLLSVLPIRFGLAGYLAPLVVLTAGYALFQAANNTALLSHGPADQRGLISGLLNLSRNLGLVTGASLMAALYAVAGMRITFAVATALLALGLGLTRRSQSVSGLRDLAPGS